MDYDLGRDEYIIYSDVGVIFDGKFKCNSTEAMLTNKNIVCEYGTFRKKQQVFPLSTIKERRGRLQMQMTTGENSMPVLEIHFERGAETLYFAKYILPMKGRARIQEWMSAIEKSLAGQDAAPVQQTEPAKKTASIFRPAASKTAAPASAPAKTAASFCPSCGTPIAPGGQFCPSCGAKVNAPQGFSEEEQDRLLKCLEELLDAGVITNDFYIEKQRNIQNH